MALEVALASVVLVAAGLFFRSFMETREIDPGFRRNGVMLAAYDLTGRRADAPAPRVFAARLLDRIRTAPAIEAAAIASSVPLDIHGMPTRFFTLEGRAREDGQPDEALANTVTPGYFEVMGIPLLAGTDFASLADTTATPQAIVNEEFVRRYLERAQPIARRIEVGGRRYSIIGVARNALYNAFGEPRPDHLSVVSRSPVSLWRDSRPGPGGRRGDRPCRPASRGTRPRSRASDLRCANARRAHRVEPDSAPHSRPHVAVLAPLLLLMAALGIYAVV